MLGDIRMSFLEQNYTKCMYLSLKLSSKRQIKAIVALSLFFGYTRTSRFCIVHCSMQSGRWTAFFLKLGRNAINGENKRGAEEKKGNKKHLAIPIPLLRSSASSHDCFSKLFPPSGRPGSAGFVQWRGP